VITNDFILVANINFIPNTKFLSDLTLDANGNWILDLSYSTYSLSNGDLLFANGETVRISSVLNLFNPTTAEEISAIANIDDGVPGDVNVSYLAGAEAYVFSNKDVESYTLKYVPTFNGVSTYSTIESYMNSGLRASGYVDVNGSSQNIYFQTLDCNSTTAVDDNNVSVTNLIAGQTGKVALSDCSTIVGAWSVVQLPNVLSNGLAVLIASDVNASAYFSSMDSNLFAIANGAVYVGEHKAVSATFVPDDASFKYNERAFLDVSAAYKANSAYLPVGFASLAGKTIFFENNDSVYGVRTFNSDGTTSGGTTTGLISNAGEYSGTYSTNLNAITIVSGGVTSTIEFASQPDFNNFTNLQCVVTENGVATNSIWNPSSPLPAQLLNMHIAYVNSDFVTGTTLFTNKGMAYDENNVSYPYDYNATSGATTIIDGANGVMTVITLPADLNLTAMSITKTDFTNNIALFAGTTTWTLPISFANDVMPLLTTSCQECHGSNGAFIVTTAAGTYDNITITFSGINTVTPSNSYLLQKVDGNITHGGGALWPNTSVEYQTILGWITDGAQNN